MSSSAPLATNLPQLQNLMKRDPESYEDELDAQLRHFAHTVKVFDLNPGTHNKSLEEIVMFLAQVAKCYAEQLKGEKAVLLGPTKPSMEMRMRMNSRQKTIFKKFRFSCMIGAESYFFLNYTVQTHCVEEIFN
jgi:hypothetical protein